MKQRNLLKTDPIKAGEDMHRLMAKLFPICRSITGEGFRQTLRILQDSIPISITEVPTGTSVFDWTVPREWNIRDAYIKDAKGKKIVDFKNSNLHVMSYSVPVHQTMNLEELKPHLYTLPEYPDRIPYRTSYYKENWGFCLPHNQLQDLPPGNYEVYLDSTLSEGSLTIGECLIPGRSQQEVLISTHSCHPSLCNDNLSGVVLSVALAQALRNQELEFSYRFLFIPGSIGSISWLSQNLGHTKKIVNGLVLACVGDPGKSTYKKSRRGDSEIDRAAEHVLKHSGSDYEILEFSPYGYDERQFCSPGINLPIGCLMRTPFAKFSEYHTSADDLDFVKPSHLADSFVKTLHIFDILENNKTYLNTNPMCEPQLGKRGLYRSIGGDSAENLNELALLWVLNQSDGSKSLLDIAQKSGMNFQTIAQAASLLAEAELLKEVNSNRLSGDIP
jgi:aminopeptidase-like protein